MLCGIDNIVHNIPHIHTMLASHNTVMNLNIVRHICWWGPCKSFKQHLRSRWDSSTIANPPPQKKKRKKEKEIFPTQNERVPVCTQGSKAANQRNCCRYIDSTIWPTTCCFELTYSLCFQIKVTFGHKLRYEIKITFGEISLKLLQTNWNVAKNNIETMKMLLMMNYQVK